MTELEWALGKYVVLGDLELLRLLRVEFSKDTAKRKGIVE